MRTVTLIALLFLSFTAQADDTLEAQRAVWADTRVAQCEFALEDINYARKVAIQGRRASLLSMVRSLNASKEVRDNIEKLYRWGFAFEYRTEKELRVVFLQECNASIFGPADMKEARDR